MISKDVLQTIIALCVIIGMVFGAANYFATAADLKNTNKRLEQKIQSDNVMDMNKRMWQLEDRNGGRDLSTWKSVPDRDEYRKLKEEVEQKKKMLDQLK